MQNSAVQRLGGVSGMRRGEMREREGYNVPSHMVAALL